MVLFNGENHGNCDESILALCCHLMKTKGHVNMTPILPTPATTVTSLSLLRDIGITYPENMQINQNIQYKYVQWEYKIAWAT